MIIRKIKIICIMLVAFCLILLFSSSVSAQGLDRVFVRFSNPQFDLVTRDYSLDVELRVEEGPQFLFGMNVRFFYDASKLEFLGFDGFHAGYGNLGVAPFARTGTPYSGLELFNFLAAASFVNSAVQLQDSDTPLELNSTQWTKAFSVLFKVPASVEGPFCPSLIWDIKATNGTGSFLRGSDGLVITLLEQNPASRQVSSPTLTQGFPFNWQYGDVPGLPYGAPMEEHCTSLSEISSSNNTIVEGARRYELFQNQPNPFSEGTLIQFKLPEAMKARLSFFTITGKQVKVVEGDYAAGLNSVKLEDSSWMGQSGVILFRLETSEYTSEMRKMTLADR